MKSLPVLISVMMVVLALPMAVKKVPPNWIYGFRTEKTMSNPEIWYAANQKAAINMIAAAVLSIAILGLVRLFEGAHGASVAGLPVVVILLFASVVLSLIQLRGM